MFKYAVSAVALSLVSADLYSAQIPCQVTASEILELASPVTGVVSEVHVDRGSWVKQGDPLLKLDDSVETTRVAYARSRYDSIGTIEARKERYRYEKRRVERNRDVMEANIISPQEADELRTALKVASLEVREAREQREVFKHELAMAEAELGRRLLSSPIDGVVVQRYSGLGEQVKDEPVLRLAQVNPLYVEAVLPASQFGKVQTGDEISVNFSVPGIGDKKLPISLVDPVVDARSGTFGIRLMLENAKLDIPAGIKCSLDLAMADQPDAGTDLDQQLIERLENLGQPLAQDK